jgi:hypothetical protein
MPILWWRRTFKTVLPREAISSAFSGVNILAFGSATRGHRQLIRPRAIRRLGGASCAIAPAATLTSNSFWTPAMLEQTTVVDAQRGGVIGVSSRKLADEPIEISGSQIQATRYTFITPYYAGSVWYDKANMWVHGEFERDGSKVQYQLET